MIAGIDYSTRAVDIVLLDETTDAASWHRFELEGADAFDRARSVGLAVPGRAMSFWDEILAVGIEDPRGYNAGSMYRVQGAILSCIPSGTLVQPWIPSAWRKAVGLSGRASKQDVSRFVVERMTGEPSTAADPAVGEFNRDETLRRVWAQDACDAYCIALATRSVLQHGESDEQDPTHG